MRERAFSSQIGFKTGSPNKKALRLAGTNEYVFSYFPERTITYAHGGKIGEVSTELNSCIAGAIAGIDGKGGIFVSGFYFSSFLFEPEQMKFLNSPKIKRVNYKNWIGSEVVRVSNQEFNNGRPLAIPRIHVVKRVANSMEGSHYSKDDHAIDNIYEAPVMHLMKYKLGALPLPYFVLLNTAQVILAKMGD